MAADEETAISQRSSWRIDDRRGRLGGGGGGEGGESGGEDDKRVELFAWSWLALHLSCCSRAGQTPVSTSRRKMVQTSEEEVQKSSVVFFVEVHFPLTNANAKGKEH